MKISQREARRLKKRVAELEAERDGQRKAWAADYPGGVRLDSFAVSGEAWWVIKTARNLGHAVVVVPVADKSVQVYGLRLKA